MALIVQILPIFFQQNELQVSGGGKFFSSCNLLSQLNSLAEKIERIPSSFRPDDRGILNDWNLGVGQY
jgi:hypothetical protein